MTHVCYQFPAIHLEGMFGVAVVVEAGGHIIERTGNLSQLVITGSIDPSCIIFPVKLAVVALSCSSGEMTELR